MSASSPFSDAPEPTSAPNTAQELLGVGAMLLGVLLLTCMDTAVKVLLQDGYGVLQVMALRGALISVGLAAWCAARGQLASLRTQRWKEHAARSVVGFCAPTLFFFALRQLPLADTTILFFAAPFLMTALAVPVLGEHVPRAHWLLIGAGFVGVVIAAQPGRSAFQLAALLPIASAASYALMAVLGRRMRVTESVVTLVFYFNAAHTLIAGAALPFTWRPLSTSSIVLFALVALLAGLGQLLITFALSRGRMSVIAPFEYSALIWSVIAGVFVFREFPAPHVTVGAVIIGLSGAYLAHRISSVERRR